MLADIDISLGARSDAYRIAELSRDFIEQGLPWRWTPQRVVRCLGDPAINVAVARDQGRVVGFAIMKYGDDTAHLWLFAVERQHQHQGIGSALLAWLEATVRVAGIRTISLQARADNHAGRSFYLKRGFIEHQHVPGMYLGQMDGVRLVKDLRPRAP